MDNYIKSPYVTFVSYKSFAFAVSVCCQFLRPETFQPCAQLKLIVFCTECAVERFESVFTDYCKECFLPKNCFKVHNILPF